MSMPVQLYYCNHIPIVRMVIKCNKARQLLTSHKHNKSMYLIIRQCTSVYAVRVANSRAGRGQCTSVYAVRVANSRAGRGQCTSVYAVSVANSRAGRGQCHTMPSISHSNVSALSPPPLRPLGLVERLQQAPRIFLRLLAINNDIKI